MNTHRHVCFPAMDPFVGAAERAQPRFDLLHQPKREAALLPPGAPADRAVLANPGQHQINPRWFRLAHISKRSVRHR